MTTPAHIIPPADLQDQVADPILEQDSPEAARMALAHAAYDSKVEGNIVFTRVDAAINWMRKNSLVADAYGACMLCD